MIMIALGESNRVKRKLWSHSIIERINTKIIKVGRMRIGQRVFRIVKFWFIQFCNLAWITPINSK